MAVIYQVLYTACFQALISNPFTIRTLPEHQQVYILESAHKECITKLKSQRLLACIEQKLNCEDM